MPELRRLGRRAFSLQDQRDFAAYSGDFNPMHVDPVYARRSIAGAPVVHGMHLLLWALETALECGLAIGLPERIHVQFLRPALIDSPLTCAWEPGDGSDDISLLVSTEEGDELARIETRRGTAGMETILRPESHGEAEPVRWEWGDLRPLLAGEWRIRFAGDLHARAWPHVCEACGADFAALLASTSRLVGMQCPGLNSLYSELQLYRAEGASLAPDLLRYAVLKADARFRFVDMELETAAYAGKIRAFVRPEPMAQAAVAAIREIVPVGAFHGQRALVVGGSRGIGEVAAKVLAAGGGEVCLTYAIGQEDAERVVADIRRAGATAISAQLDVLADDGRCEALVTQFRPTHLFYCATPFIFAGRRELFSDQLLARFLSYYVSGFERVLRLACAQGLRNAWYPSSVALDEQPADMREYCAAKAAGEALVASLARELPDLRISCPRLPRTATDQTNSLVAFANADPVAVFLSSLPQNF
ncbi:MAG: SDR family NAD(P)-dependent oxidoreductase [Betaproteobacteria bacterium]|nr:SDR family NAD(P)-dependent oxidoreductase [Betaproteobacteria bacterium]